MEDFARSPLQSVFGPLCSHALVIATVYVNNNNNNNNNKFIKRRNAGYSLLKFVVLDW